MPYESLPIYKLSRGKWKELPAKGGSTGFKAEGEIRELECLEQKTVVELEELLDRQEKILQNTNFVSKLRDRGEKLKERCAEIRKVLEEIKQKENEEQKNSFDGHLVDVAALEWNAKVTNGIHANKDSVPCPAEEEEAFERDEINPLKLLACRAHPIPKGAGKGNREGEDPSDRIKEVLERLKLEDKEAGGGIAENKETGGGVTGAHSQKNSNLASDDGDMCKDFGSKLLTALEEKERKNVKKKEPFKTFRQLTNSLESRQTKSKNPYLWVESSATGPLKPTSKNPVKLIPLKESIARLQEVQKQEMKVHLEEAQKWMRNYQKHHMENPKTVFLKYRDTNECPHIVDEDDDELDMFPGLSIHCDEDTSDDEYD